MIVNAKSGIAGVLVNLDTGRAIPWAEWADLATGRYRAYRINPHLAKRHGIPLSAIRIHGQARLNWIPLPARPKWTPTSPADAAASQRDAALSLQLPAGVHLASGLEECDEPRCHRRAMLRTGDERIISPIVAADGKPYERGLITRRHYWCEWHYRAPTSVSERGVEKELNVEVRPA